MSIPDQKWVEGDQGGTEQGDASIEQPAGNSGDHRHQQDPKEDRQAAHPDLAEAGQAGPTFKQQIIERREAVFLQTEADFEDAWQALASPVDAHGLIEPKAVVGEVVKAQRQRDEDD